MALITVVVAARVVIGRQQDRPAVEHRLNPRSLSIVVSHTPLPLRLAPQEERLSLFHHPPLTVFSALSLPQVAAALDQQALL